MATWFARVWRRDSKTRSWPQSPARRRIPGVGGELRRKLDLVRPVALGNQPGARCAQFMDSHQQQLIAALALVLSSRKRTSCALTRSPSW